MTGGSSDLTRPDATAILATIVAVARRLEAASRLDVSANGKSTSAHDPLLTAVAQTAAVVLEAQAASIALHEPVGDRLVFVAAAGPAAGEVVGLTIDASAGIAGYVFSSGQPLAVADVSRDPRFDRTVAEATGYVPRSLLATPLADEQGLVGVLEVLDRRDGTFSLHDLEVAAALAQEATIIVRRGRPERDAAQLLRGALIGLVSDEAAAIGDADAASIEVIVAQVVARLVTDVDDPTWHLADRLARLVATDPERIELAVDWLDALLRREEGRGGRRGRSGFKGR